MDVYEALYTTRSMRRLTSDPIPLDVQARILDAAIRAPSGGNSQNWRFLLVDDPSIKQQTGPIYRTQVDALFSGFYAKRLEAARANPDGPESGAMMRMYRAVRHQADHWEEVPLFLFAYALGDRSGSSIYPAVWSAMLAARAEGIGSTLTTILSGQAEVDQLLGAPTDQGWRQMACVPMGYPTGHFGVAPRRPVHEVAARNRWDGALGFEVGELLWPPRNA
jgi:nitroreductase